jgi:hypothetical protein
MIFLLSEIASDESEAEVPLTWNSSKILSLGI